jgi:enoyl-CoA hydratase/carnithine racemase
MSTPPSASSVTIERDGRVAVIYLDRAEALNVFSGGMGGQLSAAFRDADADPEVRVIVLTGRGRAFCAGADMSPEAGSFGTPGAQFSANPLETSPWLLSTPVIAAINGHAIGIGFTIALQCDIRLVAEEAKLAIPQVRRGMLGDAGSHWTVRRLAGQSVAADIMLTGRTFKGSEAVQLGLASRALPAEQVLPAALEMARDMATACSPASLALSKRLIWSDMGLDEIIRRESGYHRLLMGTPDAAEGPRAWMERRDPVWTQSAADVAEGAHAVDNLAHGA